MTSALIYIQNRCFVEHVNDFCVHVKYRIALVYQFLWHYYRESFQFITKRLYDTFIRLV